MPKPAIADSDFFGYAELMPESERAELARIREYLEAEIKPLADACWEKAEFPLEAIGRFAELRLAGYSYPEYGTGPSAARCSPGSSASN
ncbi:alkylation response protein AidB-like acyl-CoA dehydrogenase [Spinactinospora alkalitolerans]|uniref:Alkylation response protein AidB-like acyl-CoA dehydrogenase n=1 Tax=Spinactinospora alkalitolerans TaxID=687207 RepID=A0A852U4D5_9ACTN|nr:acyl-CoA dehydrogenase family protein [Spinactinospora alkalitolerans]NYE50352.1 alkylation response protein AidB-like acyl-CoA dehydrogenase [Spinactinospora alkalitolerans]